MSHSEAYYHSDAGFYIGQTPQQTKPVRSVVRDVESWGNPIGFSATNMRYVTITKSRFYNNAIGIVPNALESEKFPPAEANVITDNDVFWNNFNVHAGAPFKPKKTGVVPLVPIGTGVLLLGGRTQPRREQPDLRQLPGRRRRDRGHPARQDDRGARADRQPDHRQRLRRRRRGPQRPRPRLRRQRHRQLLGAEHRRADDAAGRRRDVPGVPVRRVPTRSARTRRTSSSASRARTRSRAGSSTRTRPSPAITPLEVYKK